MESESSAQATTPEDLRPHETTERTECHQAVQSSIENAKSFTEVQDSALKSAGDILTEMSSLQVSMRRYGSRPSYLRGQFANYKCSLMV